MELSELKVLKSAAGFYLGTLVNEDFGTFKAWIPYSRDSGYFATEAEAEAALKAGVL